MFIALGGIDARAQTAAASTGQPGGDESIYPMHATVTKAMGDMGGKYFGKIPDPAKTKHYYIAAEPVVWDFAPGGEDLVCGKTFPDSLLLNRSAAKIRYVQYADANFTARVLPQERLGILGPVLRGVTGQYLAITFLNRAQIPVSMHPHGVRYDKDSEGSYYRPAPGLGAAVAPGAKFTYVWYCDESSGPAPNEPSSKAWLYHSHATSDSEINLGLLGFIVVTDAKRARPDGTPIDVDREMAASFMIFDESQAGGPARTDSDDVPIGASRDYATQLQLTEDSQRHTINGLTFGNLQGLDMNEGERVRWYLFGLGGESDLHTPHWHGLRVTVDGRHTDSVELLPASMKVADMVADNPGTWLFHCHVADHMANGMFAAVHVQPAAGEAVSRDPEVAFFGMPQMLQTLRIKEAELTMGNDSGADEIDLDGKVTVPDPFPVARRAFSVKIGDKTLTLQPDKTGLCTSPEGTLLVKNATSFGIVRGGTLEFELTLKGQGWIDSLKRQHVLENTRTPSAALHVDLEVGDAHHSAEAPLKLAAQ
jgi:FtsP/CotA-like multicopper oxidase with cupredoxin domain